LWRVNKSMMPVVFIADTIRGDFCEGFIALYKNNSRIVPTIQAIDY